MMGASKLLRAPAFFVALVGVWWLTAWVVDTPLLAPSPLRVGEGVIILARSGDLFEHLFASLQRLCVGLAIGVPLGASIGCAMGRSVVLDAAVNPFVRMFNAIPALALVPFSLLWFGATETSRYAILIYTIALTVLLSARTGAATVPTIQERIGQTLGVSTAAAFVRIVLPACFPAILAGTHTAIGLGVMVIVAAEMLGAESGFGYLIMQARSQFNMVNMIIGVLGLGALSLALDRTFVFSIERVLTRFSVARRIG